MFIKNKYTKYYNQLIQHRKENVISEGYYENHHIIPKSLGGTDDKSNLVKLTAREHYIAHKLLTKMTEGLAKRKMWWAFHRIIHSKNSDFKLNSLNYERFRLIWSEYARDNHPSKTTDHWSDVVSNSVKKSWENDYERKHRFSKTMKDNISSWRSNNKTQFIQLQKAAALKNKEKNCESIDFLGRTYIGWSEFKRETGYDKWRYELYYKNGIPIDFRVGVNGPMNYNDITKLIEYFCYYVDIDVPKKVCTLDPILSKMVNVSLISEKQKEKYMKMFNERQGKALEGVVR